MSEIEYLRVGHVDGVLTHWTMRVWCSACGFESPQVKQGVGLGDDLQRIKADHDAACPARSRPASDGRPE